jgi:hypothetical protein
MPSDSLHEPWLSFLPELDRQLASPTELHCLGGFVVAEYYGLMRATADIDILESRGTDFATLAKLAGRKSTSISDTACTSTWSPSPMYQTTTMSASLPLLHHSTI